jgi:hypothetical protein
MDGESFGGALESECSTWTRQTISARDPGPTANVARRYAVRADEICDFVPFKHRDVLHVQWEL